MMKKTRGQTFCWTVPLRGLERFGLSIHAVQCTLYSVQHGVFRPLLIVK